MRSKFNFTPAAFALTALAFSPASFAVVQVTPTTLNDGSLFAVSNTDLLQTALAGTTSTAAFQYGGPGSLANATDGLFGLANIDAPSTFSSNDNTYVQYDLNLTASPTGYTVAQIDTYTGWDTGRDGQFYRVSYSTVADPLTFIPITTVNYNPTGLQFPNAHNLVRITDSTGTIATGVASVRFEFPTGQENGFALYRELDVLGQEVPEPASAFAALGAVALPLLRRRR